MFKIEKSIFDQLGFDFEAALEKFKAEKERHPFTVDVPAPSADPLVEAVYYAGGYEVVDSERELEPPPPPLPPMAFEPDARKTEALKSLEKLEGQTVGAQLDGLRLLLAKILEILPG
ncbi:MAG: hypothetical protein KF760_18420 [Candidatus Eremiobacteraeota bacterium]|nr:hypothetical protein [Candidatus Eremiobacteraeota bacterium]MCW5869378.1 hypothetical protein [Candidatus Eremiobacteraeota bacterium]